MSALIAPSADFFRNAWRVPALLLWSVAAATAQASDTPELTGPITITADEVDWSNNQRMEYRGNVKLTAEGFILVGDQLHIEQRPQGVLIRVEGQPAQLEQDDERVGGRVTARADQLTYDADSQWIDLQGNARLDRGKDRIEGRTIRYNVAERQVQARRAADDQQVRIVIDNNSVQRDPVPEASPTPTDEPEAATEQSP